MATSGPVDGAFAPPETGKSSRRGDHASPHGEAVFSEATVLSTQDGPAIGPHATPQDRERSFARPKSSVDQRALQYIVDLKYLSAEQLRSIAFPNIDISLVRRWLRRLAAEKWVRLWSPFTARGGKTKYALPTSRALRWALDEKRRAAEGTELARLARLLIPTAMRSPISFTEGSLPPYFAHQRQANDMVIAFHRPSVEILWATTWDRPLPASVGSFAPPQPDGIVVVRHRTDALHILFLEHDRGTEKPKTFAAAKRRYLFLALSEKFLQDTFGVASFSVLVTVQAADIVRRIAELQAATVRAGYPNGVFLFYDAAYVRATAERDQTREHHSRVV